MTTKIAFRIEIVKLIDNTILNYHVRNPYNSVQQMFEDIIHTLDSFKATSREGEENAIEALMYVLLLKTKMGV